MKKAIILISTLAFLLSYTELRQMLKVPLLVEHWNKHKKENPGTSIFEFLKYHYIVEEQNDTDEEEDGQLPFKQVTEKATDNVFVWHNVQNEPTIRIGMTDIETEYDNNLLPGLVTGIFRPPRS